MGYKFICFFCFGENYEIIDRIWFDAWNGHGECDGTGTNYLTIQPVTRYKLPQREN